MAIALTAVLGIVFVMLRTFEQLADTFVTAIMPFYALGVASIFVFRKRGGAGLQAAVSHAALSDHADPLRARDAYLLGNALIDPEQPRADAGDLRRDRVGIPVYFLTVGGGARREARRWDGGLLLTTLILLI